MHHVTNGLVRVLFRQSIHQHQRTPLTNQSSTTLSPSTLRRAIPKLTVPPATHRPGGPQVTPGRALPGLRSFGYSWAEIAIRLGTTRPAAQQGWGTR